MRHRTQRIVSLAIVVAALFASGAASADDTIEYATEHYSVETDITPRFARVVGDHMETIYREYERRFADYGEMQAKFNVKVFGTERAYLGEVPATVQGSTGVFVSRGNLLAAHADGRTAEEVLRTLYHEGFHQFMYYMISRDAPIWLNEGLAEYFSEATWNGKGFETGLVPSSRLHLVQEALRSGTYVRLRTLFALSSDEWLYNVRMDRRRASLYYSQSWAVVQFLIHADGGRYQPMLKAFMKAVSEGKDQEEAFAEVFGPNVEAFEKGWGMYMMSLRPSAKFVCRDNMEALMVLAQMTYSDLREFTSLSDLHYKLLRRGRYQWTLTKPSGESVSSRDRTAAEALFRCPFQNDAGDLGYTVVNDPRDGMPVLVCLHHPGFIIKAYFKSDGGDKPRVVIEEEVNETVREDFRRAIISARQ